jgi:general secretion pathway protein F
MTRQLSTLVKAKIQIVEALAALQDQAENDALKVILSEVKQDVNQGASLANALAKHPKVFTNVYVNMVEAGEASGNLEIVLLKLADFTESQVKLKRKIKGAMMYPIIMMGLGTVLISGIFIFIIPKLAKTFTSMKKELPTPTKLSIWISEFLQNYWYIILIVIPLSFYLFKKYTATPKGERKWHMFTLKAPIFGKIVRMVNVSRFCSTLATLLNSGVPIITAMNIVKNLIPNVHMKETIDKSKEAVKEGMSIVGPLKESGYYPTMMTHMIGLGEKSGELEEMLIIVANNYEDQVDTEIAGLSSLLEPIMIVGLGLVVAFIVFSVILPMMEMTKL